MARGGGSFGAGDRAPLRAESTFLSTFGLADGLRRTTVLQVDAAFAGGFSSFAAGGFSSFCSFAGGAFGDGEAGRALRPTSAEASSSAGDCLPMFSFRCSCCGLRGAPAGQAASCLQYVQTSR